MDIFQLERNVVLHQKLHRPLQFSMYPFPTRPPRIWLVVFNLPFFLNLLSLPCPRLLAPSMRCARLRHLSRNLFNLSDRTWRFECNKANVALLQMCRSLSNKLEAGLNTRLTKTLRGESLIPWWICAVRSTTVTWKYVRSPFYIVQQSQCVPCIYIYNIYIITLSPDFCRQSSTHTRALTRTYMYVVGMVAGWRAHRWRWYDSYIRTTIICIFPFFSIEQSSTDAAWWRKDGVLVLSCFLSDLWFLRFFVSSAASLRRNFVLSFS